MIDSFFLKQCRFAATSTLSEQYIVQMYHEWVEDEGLPVTPIEEIRKALRAYGCVRVLYRQYDTWRGIDITFGRERKMTEAQGALKVYIYGPQGSGKTRLRELIADALKATGDFPANVIEFVEIQYAADEVPKPPKNSTITRLIRGWREQIVMKGEADDS